MMSNRRRNRPSLVRTVLAGLALGIGLGLGPGLGPLIGTVPSAQAAGCGWQTSGACADTGAPDTKATDPASTGDTTPPITDHKLVECDPASLVCADDGWQTSGLSSR